MSRTGSLTVRPCTDDDVDAVLALVRADEERVGGRPSQVVADDVRDWWRTVDLPADSFLVHDGDRPEPVAVAWLERPGDDLAVTYPIAPGRHDLVDLLVDRAQARAAGSGVGRLHVAVMVPDAEAEALLERRGYAAVRHFWEMAIALDAPPVEPALAGGLTVRAVTPDDLRAFHATTAEAFADHWENHPLGFDEWWSRRSAEPDLDLAWWFLVEDGDDVLAAARSVPGRNGGVYVATLGVRRPARGRGLAKALLAHTFRRAWDAGFRRVTLGVDAQSPTGATALYRSVGMTVELETAVWETRLASS